MLSRLPINISAPAIIALPVLMLGIWLSLMWNSLARESITELADQNVKQIHELADTKIDDLVSIPPRICELNAYFIRTGILDVSDLTTWKQPLLEELEAFDMLSAITWGSDDGRSTWIARYSDGSVRWDVKNAASSTTMLEYTVDESGNISDVPSDEFEYNLFSRPWYTTPRDAGRGAWTKPYVWAGGTDTENVTIGISYGIPMYDPDGNLEGVIDADFSLTDLSRFLQSIKVGKSGIAILTTNDGFLLATSNNTPIADELGNLLHATNSPDFRIVAAGRQFNHESTPSFLMRTVRLDHENYRLMISAVGDRFGLDWRLVTIVPEKDFLQKVDSEANRSTAVSIGAVIIAIVIGLLAARWLITPLLTLVRAVRRIGKGDLETRVEIGHAPEYVALADAINEMSESLNDSRARENLLNRELDHRVKNMLAQIAALCTQAQSRASTDRPLLEDLAGQVTSLSGVHELLGATGQTGLPLEELVKQCCEPYLQNDRQLKISGTRLFVEPKAAMCLALVCNELANNARKYGSLSVDSGYIRANWHIEHDPDGSNWMTLKWTEHDGPPTPEEFVPSFGTRMLQAMIPYDVSGTVEIDLKATGLEFKTRIPIDYFSGIPVSTPKKKR